MYVHSWQCWLKKNTHSSLMAVCRSLHCHTFELIRTKDKSIIVLYCIYLFLCQIDAQKLVLAQSKGQFLGRNKQLGAGNTFFLATLFREFLLSQKLSEKKTTCLPQERSGVPLQQQNQKILPFQKSIIGLFRTQRVGELGSQMYCTVPNGTQDQLRSINQF